MYSKVLIASLVLHLNLIGNYSLPNSYLYMLSHVNKNSASRVSSAPLLSGDTFRSVADHVYDESDAVFSASEVKTGDVIFVNSLFLFNFFTEEHSKIKNPYILISHNSDYLAPGEFVKYLDDSKLIKWFGSNPDFVHEKFLGIPLGLQNGVSCLYETNIFERLYTERKEYLCCMNFSLTTNYNIRKSVWSLFEGKKYIKLNQKVPWREYLDILSKSKFTICPFGRGPDCYRVWESLYLGCIPIVLSSSLDILYKDLPILIVDSWEVVTESFLNEQYKRIKSCEYSKEKIYFNYWINKIKNTKKNYLNHNS